jgi:predicted Zn-dependent protease
MSSPASADPPGAVPAATPLPRRAKRRWIVLLLVVVVLGLGGWWGGRQLWARYHLRAAEQRLERYDFPEAVEHLERCLSIWPHSAAVRLQAARAARRADLLDRAEEHLAECEKAGVTPATGLERFLLQAQRGDLAEVQSTLAGLLQENSPDTTLILEALALGHLRLSSWGGVAESVKRLLERDPDHPWAYYWRGTMLERVQRIPRALPDYRRAVELAPHRTLFRVALAGALVQGGQPAEAWPFFQQLQGEAPTNPDVLLGTARCLRGLNRPSEALPFLDALLRDHPDLADGWAERGRAHADQGDHAEAVRCLRKALALQPGSYAIAYSLFTALREQGNDREANAILAGVEQAKSDALRLQELTLQQASQPRNASLRYEMAMIYLRKKADKEALQWFAVALSLDPNHRPTHQALADYYMKQGNTQAAAYHRERAGR